MSSLKDDANREWHLVLSIGALKRVKQNNGFDFFNADENAMARLENDRVLLGDVLASVISKQLEKANISAEDFQESISSGETVEAAKTAIAEAYLDSLPLKQQELMRQLWNKAKEVEAAALVRAKEQIEEMTPETMLGNI